MLSIGSLNLTTVMTRIIEKKTVAVRYNFYSLPNLFMDLNITIIITIVQLIDIWIVRSYYIHEYNI